MMYCDATKHCVAVQWISLLYGTFTLICSPRLIILYIPMAEVFCMFLLSLRLEEFIIYFLAEF